MTEYTPGEGHFAQSAVGRGNAAANGFGVSVEDVAYLPGSVRDGAHLSPVCVKPQAGPRRTPESNAARRDAMRVLRSLLRPESLTGSVR